MFNQEQKNNVKVVTGTKKPPTTGIGGAAGQTGG